MVNVGPVAPVFCPNGQTCPHDIVQHRYEPDRERWVCTVGNCDENPYRVIKVYPSLTFSGGSRRLELLRDAYPEATFEFAEYPKIGVEESRRTRRRRLGLRWWQRESANRREGDRAGWVDLQEEPGNSWRGGDTE